MFRTAAFRASTRATQRLATTATRAAHPRPLVALRFNSNLSPVDDARKAAQKAQNELQRDWDAKVITYNELKPKTDSPSTVRIDFHYLPLYFYLPIT